jgi:hypothetical protein
LDNSSGGSFTGRRADDAWELLDLISKNTDNWDLDKGKMIVLRFFTLLMFLELSNSYSIDSHVLLEVDKTFAKHIALPKITFI